MQVPGPKNVARIAFWRRIATWVFPAIMLAACLVFFVALAAKAGWLTMPLGGTSVSTATVLALALLLLIMLAILAYAWLAERVDRAAPERDDRR